ncbi:PadR family transcriptional regulator [Catenulispora sp. NF23]|uniref:PadR family transcriptional regulator n=1 Tax=Catenulispora pinistramenti TaxID=2705254 RepID=UPI001BADF18D|nr:PadR family transcriptional regulator [Catenulispora pinistramenti]MBS2534755.1 PadR family transcriptional regulator [Catenulispora pinistramenti]
MGPQSARSAGSAQSRDEPAGAGGGAGADGAPTDDPKLPATSWAVLGMLSFEQELSGYDIKKWADWSLKLFYWSPSFSQIYSELKRLEKHGYVTSRTVMQDDVRGKRVYAITDTGREAVRNWSRTAPVEAPVLKHGVLLRVWLGHLTEPERLHEIVAEHRDNSERRRAEAAVDADAAHGETAWAYPELALKWAERYHAAERDLAEQMLRDLDELAASGRATEPVPLPPDSPSLAPRLPGVPSTE